jgi:hypothetical protein
VRRDRDRKDTSDREARDQDREGSCQPGGKRVAAAEAGELAAP